MKKDHHKMVFFMSINSTYEASPFKSELFSRAANSRLVEDFMTDWVPSPSAGGSEENRTPVQKFFHTGISERSRKFTFPYKAVMRPTALLSSSYCVTSGGTPQCSRSPLIRRLALAVVL